MDRTQDPQISKATPIGQDIPRLRGYLSGVIIKNQSFLWERLTPALANIAEHSVFHVCISYSYIFGETSVQIICPFLDWIFYY
jgi:hypothetical protein